MELCRTLWGVGDSDLYQWNSSSMGRGSLKSESRYFFLQNSSQEPIEILQYLLLIYALWYVDLYLFKWSGLGLKYQSPGVQCLRKTLLIHRFQFAQLKTPRYMEFKSWGAKTKIDAFWVQWRKCKIWHESLFWNESFQAFWPRVYWVQILGDKKIIISAIMGNWSINLLYQVSGTGSFEPLV